MWGTLGFASCPCDEDFPSVVFAGGCGNAGRCLRYVTRTQPCDTEFNGQQFCTFDDPGASTCFLTDPTPTPTPTPTPPDCTPSEPQPHVCCTPERFRPDPNLSQEQCRWNCRAGETSCAGQRLANGCFIVNGPMVCDEVYGDGYTYVAIPDYGSAFYSLS
jgi:hypothetical protein